MRAQLHAHRIGERRWGEMIDRYGAESLLRAHEDLFAYSEACMRTAIRDLS